MLLVYCVIYICSNDSPFQGFGDANSFLDHEALLGGLQYMPIAVNSN